MGTDKTVQDLEPLTERPEPGAPPSWGWRILDVAMGQLLGEAGRLVAAAVRERAQHGNTKEDEQS